jgi:2'-hydroxyisoflavone reductase
VATLAPAAPASAALHWIDEAFLLEAEVAPWTELPLWLPREMALIHRADIGRAIASGLRCRPLAETLADTATWAAGQPAAAGTAEGPPRPGVGLAPAREAELLARWHARGG